MPSLKLWNRDFTLVVIGQIISLFGNAILRFALPLYLLDITGSSAIYGAVLACSTIPMILLSPVGGILADRVNKRNIMVALDFITTFLILGFSICMGNANKIILILSMMVFLYAIQGVYQPTVQSSIPSLVNGKQLLSANAVINQVNSLSGILGPVIGGLLYGVWGLPPILLTAGIFFFSSAVLEVFIHIPYTPSQTINGIFSIVKNDFKDSIQFVRNEKPVIWKVMCIVAVFNLFLTSMLLVGMPVLITQILKMSSQLYGYAQGALMAGGIVGGIAVGVLGKKLKIHHAYLLLFGTALTILPIGIVFLLHASTSVSYVTISLCAFLFMMVSTVFSIQMLAFIQGETPPNLIGKVISCVLMLSLCAQPIGNAMYGVLFDLFSAAPWIIIFGVLGISVFILLISKKVFFTMK